jgi:predicted nucleic acid-binding protein
MVMMVIFIASGQSLLYGQIRGGGGKVKGKRRDQDALVASHAVSGNDGTDGAAR